MTDFPDEVTPEMLERARRIEGELKRKLAEKPVSIGSLARRFLMTDEEYAEWEAAEPEEAQLERERDAELEQRRASERGRLQEVFPGIGEPRARMLQLTLARMDNLAMEIADTLGWPHSADSYEKAKKMRAAYFSLDARREFGDVIAEWDYQRMVNAYVDAVDARTLVFEGCSLRDSLERLTSAASQLLMELPQNKRREDARAAAAAGWEWLEEVRQEAFRRRDTDLVSNPNRSRRQSILGMMNDIRTLYDEKGKARNVTLSEDPIQAFKTIESWFIKTGRK